MKLPGWLRASSPSPPDRARGTVQVQLTPDPEFEAAVRSAVKQVERQLTRPDVVVGQSLDAAYSYLASRSWLDGPRPKVMSTAPQDHHGRIVLVITDPTTLDPDLWRQLADRDFDRLDVVVRP